MLSSWGSGCLPALGSDEGVGELVVVLCRSLLDVLTHTSPCFLYVYVCKNGRIEHMVLRPCAYIDVRDVFLCFEMGCQEGDLALDSILCMSACKMCALS